MALGHVCPALEGQVAPPWPHLSARPHSLAADTVAVPVEVGAVARPAGVDGRTARGSGRGAIGIGSSGRSRCRNGWRGWNRGRNVS